MSVGAHAGWETPRNSAADRSQQTAASAISFCGGYPGEYVVTGSPMSPGSSMTCGNSDLTDQRCRQSHPFHIA